MNLDRVTITGPDDSIAVADLVPLSREFPFVEWGILVSGSHLESMPSAAAARFPSINWISDLRRLAESESISLSLHVCGRWTRGLLLGNLYIPPLLTDTPIFKRIQLNFHAENTPCDAAKLLAVLRSLGKRQYIFQIDGANGNQHLESLYAENDDGSVDAVPLFDISGGAGILPTEWPKPIYMSTDSDCCYHGYAGGLGPDNLEIQLPLIGEAAGNTRIWIDMETRVRSANDRQFDLEKVRRCLEICAPHVMSK